MDARFHPAAGKELKQALAYYEQQASGLGEAFLNEARKAVNVLADQSELGSPLPGQDLRRWPVRRFPNLIRPHLPLCPVSLHDALTLMRRAVIVP
jgi:hypothetical protein